MSQVLALECPRGKQCQVLREGATKWHRNSQKEVLGVCSTRAYLLVFLTRFFRAAERRKKVARLKAVDPRFRAAFTTTAFRRCERIGIWPFPSLHHRKEGWPSDQTNIVKPPLTARTGWFSERDARKTTPSASASVAARYFLGDAATPCGDARRGI